MNALESAPVAPASPASTTPAAPVSTPSAPAERPRSFSESFERTAAAEAPAIPGAVTTTTDQPALATEAPVAPVIDPANVPPVKGEPPREKWEHILGNARTKAREEAIAEIQTKHQRHIDWGQAIEADPRNALHLVKDVLRDPVHGPGMRAELGKMFGSLRQPAQTTPAPAADPEPPRFLTAPDGSLVYDPAVDQTWREWNNRQVVGEVRKEFDPLIKAHQTAKQKEAVVNLWHQTNRDVSGVIAQYKDQPHFREHKADILAHVEAQFKARPDVDPRVALGLAYSHVLHSKVLPSQKTQSQQDLVAQAVEKSAGRTDNPAASAPRPPGRPKTWHEAFAQQGLAE